MSRDALVGLLGVALGALVSLIGVWVEGGRQARRTAEERQYQWVKDRLDKVEEYITPLIPLSHKLRRRAKGVLRGQVAWWTAPDLEKPQVGARVTYDLGELEKALDESNAIDLEQAGVFRGSLEPKILNAVSILSASFQGLMLACYGLLSERDEASRQARDAHNLGALEAWKSKWYDKVESNYATFEKTHRLLVDAMRRALTEYRPPSLLDRLGKQASRLERLREWYGRRR